MKIFSWNVNGIRAVVKKGVFMPFVEKYQPDILCLQETKAAEGQAEIDLPDYEEYWHSAEKKGYSGTAIFTKIPPVTVYYGIPNDIKAKHQLLDAYGDTSKEGRVVTLEFENFFVSTVYTPNAKDDLSRLPVRQHWDEAFLEYMKQLEKNGSTPSTSSGQEGSPQGKPVIFCGDLNVAHTEDDLARPKENRGKKGFTDEERSGISRYIEEGFVDTFRKFHTGNGYYTWWSHFSQARERNVGWRIDYIFTSKELADVVTHADIHPDVYGSDHCPVSLKIEIE